MIFCKMAQQSCRVLISARVFCAAMATSTFAAETSENFGKWQVNVHKDAMDDSRFIIIMLQSEDDGVVLGVNCRGSDSSVGIVWDRFLGGEKIGGVEYKPMVYRVDDKQPLRTDWPVMSDRSTTRADAPERFVSEVMSGERLAIRIEPYQNAPLTVLFDTKGLTSVLMANRPECDGFVRNILWDKHLARLRQEKAANEATGGRTDVAPVPFVLMPLTEDALAK
ncbi:hypothetical protein RJJ65_20615 [Rhizobium hidalgonense]|uniref:Uncharacterized protein n=1 Tax=Rhizobium hidalgonense TaxID=1538159 RepID=A0AAJ2GSP2_9HYPH|nr:hypothetical protein [Rhizobium hidalgonense]MDR9775012.1 hypothetical protein [Rhizobium hidalgonense]MDR9823492.1 hypothetical protein [Rhizobium hidalgonense]